MQKILVTGGSGLVGRHLKDVLPEAEYISSEDYDLRSEAEVARLFGAGWDHVIHLAARVGGILDNINHPAEFIEDNLMMNTLVLKYARAAGVRKFTAVLSTCIYPDVFDRYPLMEEDLHSGAPQLTNFAYATAKRALAVHIDAYNKEYGLAYNYLIPCNLYGKYDRVDYSRNHFLTAMVAKILDAEQSGATEIQLLGTGKPLRQFLYAGDLADILKRCVFGGMTESFNVATPDNLSIREIAERALVACGHEEVKITFDMTSPDGQFRKDVSTVRMQQLLPDYAFTPLEVGIKATYDAMKGNPKR